MAPENVKREGTGTTKYLTVNLIHLNISYSSVRSSFVSAYRIQSENRKEDRTHSIPNKLCIIKREREMNALVYS